MNDLAVARELGELRGQINSLIEQWAKQDAVATEGRRLMHQDLNNLTMRQAETRHEVSSLTKKVNDEVMPVIRGVQTDRWRFEGMKTLSKLIYTSLGAFLFGLSWVLYTFLGIGKPPH